MDGRTSHNRRRQAARYHNKNRKKTRKKECAAIKGKETSQNAAQPRNPRRTAASRHGQIKKTPMKLLQRSESPEAAEAPNKICSQCGGEPT
jgi:hypothetical protein